MIVVCPHCSKRYMLDDNLVPKQGRQVRCIACQNIWHQDQATLPPALNPFSLNEIDMALESPVKTHKKSGWASIFVVLSLLIFFFSGVTFGREFVVKFWPQAARYYQLVGLPMGAQGDGLTITNASSLIHQNEFQEMIQVAGDITNTSDHVRHIPPLKVKIMDGGSHVLDSWEHRLSEQSLLPGEQIRFETEPRPKIAGTHHVFVEF